MKHITELQDIGIGKRCIIIGGGLSVRDFQFEKVPADMVYICTNNHCRGMANIIIYYDRNMYEYYQKHEIYNNQLLIGFKSGKVDYTTTSCTHYYSNYKTDNYTYGDTGFHSLQFADTIFNFSEIFLIGFDYYTNGKTYHHDENESDKELMERFKIHSIGRVLSMYDNLKLKNKVYNCNPDSAIKIYEYKLPVDK